MKVSSQVEPLAGSAWGHEPAPSPTGANGWWVGTSKPIELPARTGADSVTVVELRTDTIVVPVGILVPPSTSISCEPTSVETKLADAEVKVVVPLPTPSL